MRFKIGFALLLVAAAVTAFTYGTRESRAEGVQDAYTYYPPKPVRSFPASYATVQGWINSDDSVKIRAHAWDIWESITAKTLLGHPTWQTWYTGHELFEMTTQQTRARARGRHGLIEFEQRPLPVPVGHRVTPMLRTADGIPFNRDERTFSFNRFTQSAARYIWRNRLNNGNMLLDTLNAMVANGRPIASREVLTSADSTDSTQFVLKTVFQFISGTQVTAVPIWTGDDTSATYTPGNPVPSRWRRAIAVDPTGKYKRGDSLLMVVNNEPPQWLTVYPVSDFYNVKITPADSANFSVFGPINGDFIGVANDTSAQAVYMAVRPGNYGLLMAMHVTGKETPNWTWQSYWWAIDPQDPQFGADRPRTIPRPWNHYNMTVAYSMTHPNGSPRIAFNPYLETSLEGKLPNGPGNPADSTPWTGVTSNCMSCHRRASVGWFTAPPPKPGFQAQILPTFALYGPAALVSAGDSVIFTQQVPGITSRVPLLKTDFLWSVAIRASLPNDSAYRRR